jgi:hypothetical protein
MCTWFVWVGPPGALAAVVRGFKGRAARVLCEEFPHLRNFAMVLWSPVYFAVSVGSVSETTVRRYIEYQWDAVLASWVNRSRSPAPACMAASYVWVTSQGLIALRFECTVTDITDAQARHRHSFLAAMPGEVLGATLKTEAAEGFLAGKHCKTNKVAGRRPEAMPGFRRKDADQRFVCWFNGDRDAVFTKTGHRSGMVAISGANPRTRHAPGRGAHGKPHTLGWKVMLHVGLSQPIRLYTWVQMNEARRVLRRAQHRRAG